jgi:hypothetical protein
MLGKYFIAFCAVSSQRNADTVLYVIGWCSVPNEATPIQMLNREGPFYSLTYKKSDLVPRDLVATSQQHEVMDEILRIWSEKSCATVLLTGDPGSGKSTLAFLLAQKFLKFYGFERIFMTDSWRPSDPNDSFGLVYESANTHTSPLIVLLEEVDCLFENIVNQTIVSHKYYPIMMRTKTDWNVFFDKFDRQQYKNVVLIMTSNRPLDFFCGLDASMIRDARISLRRHISVS